MKKIVIQVHMENDKCRSKALKIAAAPQGVHSVALEGESRDQVAVSGEKIDSVCLTKKFRKKFSHATLVSVADINASDDAEEQKDETASPEEFLAIPYSYANFPPPPPCPSYVVNYDPYPNTCSIL